MTKIVTKKNIPEGGDIVDGVKFNKARTMGCVIFDSGKKVFFTTDPVEFGKKASVSSPSPSQESVIHKTSKGVNAMDKNTPSDEAYTRQVQETLARMRGVPVEQILEESSAGQDIGATAVLPTQPTEAMEDFEAQKQAIMEKSEARSRMLAEELSRSSGGRLDNSFNGKNSISMGG